VRALEAWLGVPLFRRTSGPPVRLLLTEEAQVALADITTGFDRLASGLNRLRAAKGAGIVTVTASPAFAAKWLLPRIDRFRAAYPEFDVRLDATDRLVDLAEGDADIGVRYGGGRWPGLDSVRLMDEEVFPVCSPALLAGAHPLRTPADLAHRRFCTTRRSASTPTSRLGVPGWLRQEWKASIRSAVWRSTRRRP
jgi:LysR family glycine cleavage system transcriptional activator